MGRCEVPAQRPAAAALTAVLGLAAAHSASPGSRPALTDVESLRMVGLVEAMAAVERRLPSRGGRRESESNRPADAAGTSGHGRQEDRE
jgi:hypothetical protein